MRFVGLAALVIAVASCDPNIASDEPSQFLRPRFDLSDKPQLPYPDDLLLDDRTGLLVLAVDVKQPPAEQEFVRDYLSTLDGWPPETVAKIEFTDALDPETVNEGTIVALDLGPVDAATPLAEVVKVKAELDEKGTALTVVPEVPWKKGRRYVVAVRGYEYGVKGKDGAVVAATPHFALARSKKPLVTCDDLSSDACEATTEVVPVTSLDPEEKRAERNALAVRLERARRLHAAGLEAIERPVDPITHLPAPERGMWRTDCAVALVFRTVNQTLVTFDPTRGVVPFPNDLFHNGLTVSVPAPLNAPQIVQALYASLGLLDGFSMTAPVVSENAMEVPAFDSEVDPASVTGESVRLWNLSDPDRAPSYRACVNCQTFGPADKLPQQVQAVPEPPLRPATRYAAALTRAIRDRRGQKVNLSTDGALVRLSVPLLEQGKSSIGIISLDRARAIEPHRARYRALFDDLASQGVPRSEALLAWAFTTQRTTLQAQVVYMAPQLFALTGGLSGEVLTNPPPVATPANTAVPPPYPKGNLRHVVRGRLEILDLLDPTLGVITPRARAVPTDFVLALPKTAPASRRYPVVIFLHGWRSDRSQALAVADAFAANGSATLAIDLPWHGERTTCANYPLGNACAGGGTCDAQSGKCSTDFARDARGVPQASGWNFVNPINPFGTRDNFRQTVADVAQVVRVLRDPIGFRLVVDDPATPGVTESLDGSKIRLAGVSLGAMNGVLVAAVSPDIQSAVLSAPTGNLLDVVMTSPAFLAHRLLLIGGLASQGIESGTPQFEDVLNIIRWTFDAGDAVNFGEYLVRDRLQQIFPPTPLPSVPVLMQWVQPDGVFPNETTQALLRAAAPRAASPAYRESRYTGAAHSFLVDFANLPVTQQAQTEAAQWLR